MNDQTKKKVEKYVSEFSGLNKAQLFKKSMSALCNGRPPERLDSIIRVATSIMLYLEKGGSIDDYSDYSEIAEKMLKYTEATKEREKANELDLHTAKKFIQLSNRAELKKLDMNLSLADVKALLSRKYCQYTKEEMIKLELSEGQEPPKNMLTFDRVDSSKGYVKGNVVAVCHWANQLKNDLFERTDLDIQRFKYEDSDRIIEMLKNMKSFMK